MKFNSCIIIYIFNHIYTKTSLTLLSNYILKNIFCIIEKYLNISAYETIMVEYAIIFDIPRQESILRVRINRALKLIGAKMIQKSIWKSDSLEDLKGIAKFIKEHGGKVHVIEWKKIY